MYNPIKTGVGYEWIEFYNPNDIAIFVNSWSIADSNEKDNIIPNEGEIITIPAKKVGIFTSSPKLFKETYSDYKYIFSVEDLAIGNGLGNNETIILSKNSYNDVFSYTIADGANANGKTLSRSCYNCNTWNETNASPGSL